MAKLYEMHDFLKTRTLRLAYAEKQARDSSAVEGVKGLGDLQINEEAWDMPDSVLYKIIDEVDDLELKDELEKLP